jgi:hypothetical protein
VQDHTFTLILSAVGIGGALAGIVIGHFLTRSSQHRDWLRDKRREEYREVLNATTAAYMAIMHIRELGELGITASPELELTAERAIIESFRTLRDRILIAEDIVFADSLSEWDVAVQNYRRTKDEHVFAERFSLINKTLVEMAGWPAGKPNILKRLQARYSFWRALRKAKRRRQSV